MNSKRTYGIVLLAFALLWAAGCKPVPVAQTIVAGLTLPSGAVEAPLSAPADELFREQQKQSVDERSKATFIMKGFNYKGDLEAVAAHVEKHLKTLGWKRLKPFYIPGRMGGVIQKVYWSPDKYSQIQLTDWTQQNMTANDFEGKARFTILVLNAVVTDRAGNLIELGGDQNLEDL